MLPELLEEGDFVGAPVARDPRRDHAGGQTEESHQPHDGETTAWCLDGLLRVKSLIIGRILRRHSRAVDCDDVTAAPKIPLGDSLLTLGKDVLMNLIQRVQGDVTATLAIRAGFIGRDFSTRQLAAGLRLANGLAAGGAWLRHLPEESPEDQAQGPTALAGVLLVLLLGQAMARDAVRKEGFELMEGRPGGGAEAVELGFERESPGWEVRCHRTVYILSY